MGKVKVWSPEEDAELARLYVVELQSLILIERTMRRRQTNIRQRIVDLGLRRSEAAFQRAASVRREAGQAKVLRDNEACRPFLRAPRVEDHWKICLAHGGFEGRRVGANGETIRLVPVVMA